MWSRKRDSSKGSSIYCWFVGVWVQHRYPCGLG
jgi:hypothetical protein